MTFDQLEKLLDAGFTKDDIMALMGGKTDVAVAAPAAPAAPEAPAAPAAPAAAPAGTTDPEPARNENPDSEIAFLRQQVRDLQKANLLFASGKYQQAEHTESVDDIMKTLLGGNAPAR